MTKIYEDDIEQMAVEELEKLGFEFIHGPDIEPKGSNPLRTYQDVLINEHVMDAIARLNPTLTEAQCAEVFRAITQIYSTSLISDNKTFHRLLTEGINLEVHQNGETKGLLASLIDFDQPLNNKFYVVNQVTIRQDRHERRPDLILYINGLPLVVIELKNPASETATMETAYKQIQTYQSEITNLFTYNTFNIISDGLEAKAGTISADLSRYMAWKTSNGLYQATSTQPQLNVMIEGMLNPVTLLDLIRHFIVFEEMASTDQAGIKTIKTVKKLAAYHQYYAVNAAVLSTIRAADVNAQSESAEVAMRLQGRERHHLVPEQKAGDRKAGVVWHTQGSGKSLSMVFYTGKIVLALNNPTIVILTDRNDLDDQLFGTFGAAKQLLRQTPQQADSSEELKELLKVESGGVIFTTIQKFQADNNEGVFETLSNRSNIVVIADEAHRSQYGFHAKEIDVLDESGNIIGKRTAYGYAKYLRDALPNATYLGFTGTPIEKTDVNTPAVFGNYVDIYDISQAVEDGATVRIYYESRLAKVRISEEGQKIIEEFDNEFNEEDLNETQQVRAKWARIEGLIGSKERIKAVAQDIVEHFTERLKANADQGKGMIVCMSRRIAVDLYNAIIAIKPEWHSDDLNDGTIKVVMTSSASDGPVIAKHHTTKKERQDLAKRMKDEDDKLKLVIVRDMWLTGFDAPSMHTLYIDKPMKGHNLMQAIARVNRVYKDKTGGLVVDYLGIASDLKSALSFYSDAGGKGDPAELQEEAVTIMQEKLEILENMMHGYDYTAYFTASTSDKLRIILESEDHILGLDDGKKRFMTAVTALSQAFALAAPHPTAMEASREVAYFQTIKARLIKFDNGSTAIGNLSEDALEKRVKQTIDQALVADSVVDIFDAAGIQKPDISILSDEFMEEMRDYQHKNIALETLKKLLSDEVSVRERKNKVEGKKLYEMLKTAINSYQNKVLTAAEVIDELIKLAKTIQESDQLASELGLTDYEYAFYTAVANNDSARELMQKDKLRELAVVLTDRIRKNATLDWTKKESAKANLRVVVKRLLRQFGYPPDMTALATETVLEQAEKIAADLLQNEKF
ncbi:DEAD/DEAH box helicase [Wohlfahrtiimonas chitiniclastica]|uniref:type I restriction endonuclease subunit R n=1 Tax=Wohlfahrtiimonas chitiniclastica TaxID=400946 RepID=UPI000B98E14B|nr:type I restriction endonuclease subunit R [Wohlfahrtiimonas chitiniclastica]OYQ85897.1 DEAD/DEAH box helicase [Wohlfahrtiimonas chitiniclastica]